MVVSTVSGGAKPGSEPLRRGRRQRVHRSTHRPGARADRRRRGCAATDRPWPRLPRAPAPPIGALRHQRPRPTITKPRVRRGRGARQQPAPDRISGPGRDRGQPDHHGHPGGRPDRRADRAAGMLTLGQHRGTRAGRSRPRWHRAHPPFAPPRPAGCQHNGRVTSPGDPLDESELRPEPPRSAQMFTIRERIRLTIQYNGIRSLLYRVVTYPLRFTPLRHRVTRGLRPRRDRAARDWYRRNARPVTLAIPATRTRRRCPSWWRACAGRPRRSWSGSSYRTTQSGPEHVAALRAIEGVVVVDAAANAGFAANVNRGTRAAAPGSDVVLLNSDMIAARGWLESLQYAARGPTTSGSSAASCSTTTAGSSSRGTVRNLGAPGMVRPPLPVPPADFGPANVPQPMLAVTGACMYLKRDLLDRLGAVRRGAIRWPTRMSTTACGRGRPASR